MTEIPLIKPARASDMAVTRNERQKRYREKQRVITPKISTRVSGKSAQKRQERQILVETLMYLISAHPEGIFSWQLREITGYSAGCIGNLLLHMSRRGIVRTVFVRTSDGRRVGAPHYNPLRLWLPAGAPDPEPIPKSPRKPPALASSASRALAEEHANWVREVRARRVVYNPWGAS